MNQGIVNRFDNGWGFIKPDDGGRDVFVHWSGIDMPGRKSLRAGQRVSYRTQDTDRGIAAIDVKPLD